MKNYPLVELIISISIISSDFTFPITYNKVIIYMFTQSIILNNANEAVDILIIKNFA